MKFGTQECHFKLIDFTYSDWAWSTDDRKNTSDFVFNLKFLIMV